MLLARTEAGLAGAWFEGQKHHPDAARRAASAPTIRCCIARRAQLRDYFAGERTRFDVPLDLQGTAFQRAVWQALLRIEAGATRSYGEIARELGQPSAAAPSAPRSAATRSRSSCRATACVGSDGALTGYAGGLDRKTALLRLEAERARSRRGARRWSSLRPRDVAELLALAALWGASFLFMRMGACRRSGRSRCRRCASPAPRCCSCRCSRCAASSPRCAVTGGRSSSSA